MTRSSAPSYWPGARKHLRTDPVVAELIRAHGPPEYRRTRNTFASLVHAIVYQQLSPAAAGTIHGRFLALYGGRPPTPAQLLETRTETLRNVGLSAAKARYVHDLAAHFDDGRLSGRKLLRWSDDRVAGALLAVKGLGPWSVDMFLMFALQRPDILPVGDLGVQKGMQLRFGLRDLPKPARMHELSEIWRPYRSAASWYMWRLTEARASRKPAAGRRAKSARRAEAPTRRRRRRGE